MFWTAFIWGLGTTLGGSVGLMAFVVMNTAWNWLASTKAAKETVRIGQLSVDALNHRNELTEEQIRIFDRIATCAERQHFEG